MLFLQAQGYEFYLIPIVHAKNKKLDVMLIPVLGKPRQLDWMARQHSLPDRSQANERLEKRTAPEE